MEKNINKVLYSTCKVLNFKKEEQIITICAIRKSINENCTQINFGYSVQNTIDKYNKEKGNLIAFNRASKSTTSEDILICSNSGTLNDKVIQFIMEDKLNYWKHNLGVLIKGYNEAELKYLNKEAAKYEIKSLTADQLNTTKILAKASQKDITHAKNLIKYIKDEYIKDTTKNIK